MFILNVALKIKARGFVEEIKGKVKEDWREISLLMLSEGGNERGGNYG